MLISACNEDDGDTKSIKRIYIEATTINQNEHDSSIVLFKHQSVAFKAFVETNKGNKIEVTELVTWFFSVNLKTEITNKGALSAGPYAGKTQLFATYKDEMSAPFTIIIK